MAKGDPILPAPISFVTGPLGSGKSYFAMRYIFKYLYAGKLIACNFDLHGDFAKTLSEMGFSRRRSWTPEQRVAWAHECRERALKFDIQDDLYNYELPGEGEDRGLLVIDEAGLSMNSRQYSHRQKKDAARYGEGAALKSLEFYINMRKKGWSSLILAHSSNHLDNQVRDMGGQIIKLRNLARIKVPFTPFKMARKPRFVAIHIVPDTKPAMIHKREIYGLNIAIANHYRSMETFDADPEAGHGTRRQAQNVKLARQPYQPFYTWDGGAARRRAPTTGEEPATSWEEGAPPHGDHAPAFTGSPGSWRTSGVGR